MRISDWSSDVCSSDLGQAHFQGLRLDVGLGQEDAEITKRLAFSRQARAKLLDRRFGVDVIEATQILRELREDLRHFRRLLGIDRGVEEDAEGAGGILDLLRRTAGAVAWCFGSLFLCFR